jgi:serine/threonine protein kinase
MTILKKTTKTSAKADKLFESFKKGKRYYFLKKIGEGGLGTVCSYFDTYLNRVIAVKELKRESRKKQHCVQSFINEAKLISYLDHPGVVSVFNTFFWDDASLCYSMNMVEGCNLAVFLEEHSPQSRTPSFINPCLDIAKKLCETLAFVHDRGVIHLDLKPENIMIGRYGEVMVMDWGSARLYDSKPYFDYLHSHTGKTGLVRFEEESPDVILGTPMYMSPEQTCSTRDCLSPASDIFSAGIIFYEMFAGVHPFPAGDVIELLRQVREHRPPPLHEVNYDIPRRLSQICQKMMEKTSSKRYRSFQEVLSDITEFQNSGQTFATRTFQAGEIIFREGDPGDYAFIVLAGKVGIIKKVDGQDTIIAELGRDEIVGELAVFTHQTRTATVVALDPTTIRMMSKEEVEGELEKLSPWVGKMITGLSKRFIDLNEKMVRQGARSPCSQENVSR